MPEEYIIITDATSDLTPGQCAEYGLTALPIGVRIADREFKHYCDGREMSFEEFYRRLRSGEQPSTSAPSPGDWEGAAREALQAGKGALFLTFSSGLACTYNNACIAKEQLLEEFPTAKIEVVDTLCADFGEAMFVVRAAENRKNGMSLYDNARWAEQNRQKYCHWFVVDDLQHLRRGGRMTATTAVVGTMLGIKPLLHIDEEGRLINVGTVRGRKKAIDAIADKVGEYALEPESQTMFICHADCIEDAEALSDEIKSRFGVPKTVINYTGVAAGAHAGPGTLAVFFIGRGRDINN